MLQYKGFLLKGAEANVNDVLHVELELSWQHKLDAHRSQKVDPSVGLSEEDVSETSFVEVAFARMEPAEYYGVSVLAQIY